MSTPGNHQFTLQWAWCLDPGIPLASQPGQPGQAKQPLEPASSQLASQDPPKSPKSSPKHSRNLPNEVDPADRPVTLIYHVPSFAASQWRQPGSPIVSQWNFKALSGFQNVSKTCFSVGTTEKWHLDNMAANLTRNAASQQVPLRVTETRKF